jgi:hypothetical protein
MMVSVFIGTSLEGFIARPNGDLDFLPPGGDGVPLFGSLARDIRLRHVATRHYPSGLVSSEYHVAA